MHQLIAHPIAVDVGDALALEAYNFAALRAGINLESCFGSQRGHLHLGAQGGIGKIDVELVDHVVPLADEALVLGFFHLNQQVASFAATLAGVALAA